MSTENITGLDEAASSNAAAVESVRARAEELAQRARQNDEANRKEQEDAAIIARALRQRRLDEAAVIDEEVGQLTNILGTPEPAPELQAPVEPEQPSAEPEPQVVDHDGNGQDDNAGNPPTSVVPFNQEPEESRRNNARLRNWRGLAWLLAILLAIMGDLVGAYTYDDVFINVGNDVAFGILSTFWVVAMTALGFFAGGWIGYTLENRRRREH